ncbi:MAG: guanylate kinase [Deltaproteobacteria bacterium]|nr:guanylate kinase [Deltaproteobacteria bacterium]
MLFDLTHKSFIFLVSAPSGCGKSTLLSLLFQDVAGLSYSISHTTRPPRATETEGIDYFFVDEAQFIDMCNRDMFIEWACVHGHYYGTSKAVVDALIRTGNDVVLDIDVQGFKRIKDLAGLDIVSLFIMPPSMQELRRRLVARGQNEPQDLECRLGAVETELRHAHEYDYILVNEVLSVSRLQMQAIVLSERIRSVRLF